MTFVLTNIVFSLIIGLVLVRLNTGGKTKTCSNLELMLYSLGLGPVFTVLILYFLLMVLRGHSDFFYLAAVTVIYLVLAVLGRKSVRPLVQEVKEKSIPILYFSFLLILLAAFIFLFMSNTLQLPIEGHDTLIHGNIGKMYYQEKAVTYSETIHNKQGGFYFTGSPKPAFSLLLTWEMIVNGCFSGPEGPHVGFDIYFRSISAYYGLLILLTAFLWLYRKNRYLALLGIVVLFSGLKFFLMFTGYHLDSYRMFFLILSWIFLAYSLKQKTRLSFFLLGVFSGFAAFIHLIGVVAAAANCLAFFIFLEKPFKERLLKTLALCLAVLLSGGIHYILDIVWGAKWGFLTYF
ncbi:MAG: hypothetical protein GY950_37690 [bacterium]|nr:hypothetical protein [bacterium]